MTTGYYVCSYEKLLTIDQELKKIRIFFPQTSEHHGPGKYVSDHSKKEEMVVRDGLCFKEF